MLTPNFCYSAERGIILADTKLEFALDESTTPPSVVLVDEVLTPDSSVSDFGSLSVFALWVLFCPGDMVQTLMLT